MRALGFCAVAQKCPQGTAIDKAMRPLLSDITHTTYHPSRRVVVFVQVRARPRLYALKRVTPRLRARLRFRITKHGFTYCKVVCYTTPPCNVPCFVAPPLPPQRAFLRAALQAGGVLVDLPCGSVDSGVCVPHPARFYRALLRNGLCNALVFH